MFPLLEGVKRAGHRWLSPAPTIWGNRVLGMAALR